MAACIAILSSLVLLFGDAVYVRETMKKKSFPMKSTWMIFALVTGLSVASFMKKEFDIISGLYNISDFIFCIVIFIVIVKSSKDKFKFKTFEKYYLLSVFLLIVLWILSSNSFLTNIMAQCLLLVGYGPMFHDLAKTKKLGESKLPWLIWVFGSSIAIIPAFMNDNTLAIIYSIRGATMCLIIFLLTLKYGINKRSPK